VMNKGKVAQSGTPREIYEHPRADFVAEFVGSNNVWKCSLIGTTPPHLLLKTGFGADLKVLDPRGTGRALGEEVIVCVRPEGIQLGAATGAEQGSNLLRGRVTEAVYLGAYNRYQVDVGGGESVTADSKQKFDVGQELAMAVPPENFTVIE
jgi:ABC-type Fe3+/spermidine/putrescine transport system ATPase subunit